MPMDHFFMDSHSYRAVKEEREREHKRLLNIHLGCKKNIYEYMRSLVEYGSNRQLSLEEVCKNTGRWLWIMIPDRTYLVNRRQEGKAFMSFPNGKAKESYDSYFFPDERRIFTDEI